MKQTYNVYDQDTENYVAKDLTSSKIAKIIGISGRIVSKYAENGFRYKGRYLITKETNSIRHCGVPVFAVYDMVHGVYVADMQTTEMISEKFEIKAATINQYCSTRKRIKNKYLIFRVSDPPTDIIFPSSLLDDWDDEVRKFHRKKKVS